MAAKSVDGRFEWLVLAAVVTAAAAAVPGYAAEWAHRALPWLHGVWIDARFGRENFDALFALAFGLILVLPHPVRGGLGAPDLKRSAWLTVGACAACLLVTFLFNRRLDVPQLRGSGPGYWMWLAGPPAADLVFLGFLFGKFDQLWPKPIASWLPVRWAVVLSAAYFSLWHAQNFQSMDPPVVQQQMLATLVFGFAMGLTRQWTGSILPAVVTHVGVNWMTWHGTGLAAG